MMTALNAGDPPDFIPPTLEETERRMITEALRKYRGKRKDAAQDLGISERTLYRKVKELDIEI